VDALYLQFKRKNKMILPNKLNVTNQLELNNAEEKSSKQKAKQLFESGKINQIEVRTFMSLA
jgi:cell filamentation protein